MFFFSVLGTEGLTSTAVSSSSILKSKKASYISEAAAFLASSVVGCGEEVFTFTGCFSLDALDCLFLLFLFSLSGAGGLFFSEFFAICALFEEVLFSIFADSPFSLSFFSTGNFSCTSVWSLSIFRIPRYAVALSSYTRKNLNTPVRAASPHNMNLFSGCREC